MNNEQAQFEQGGLDKLLVPALVAGGIFFLVRRRGSANGGGGSGGGGEVPAEMARVAGGIGGIHVQQAASHGQIDKAVGSSLIVTVNFRGGTTKKGSPVEWPYFVQARIGHTTLAGVKWTTAGDGIINFRDLSGNFLKWPWSSLETRNSGGTGTVRMPTLRIPSDPNVSWDVRVKLFAQESDAFGEPNGTWVQVGDEFRHDDAFRITPASVASSIGGTITNVPVAQGPSLDRPGRANGARRLSVMRSSARR